MGMTTTAAWRRVTRTGEGDGVPTAAYRVAAAVALALLVLAALGAVLGPQWDPELMHDSIPVTTRSTAIGDAPLAQTYEVRTEDVRVELDGGWVEARLSLPVGATGPLPGVVFVHGAGTGRFTQAFVTQAHALAASGVVAMVPNKRLDTYTLRHRDYVEMAADYARSVDVLRARPEVDPARVGVYAESEGGWIAPVMAAQDPDLAFVVLVSSPVVPPRQQAAFAVDAYLRNTGVPQGVFRAIPRAVGLTSFPGGNFDYIDFDVTPYQQRMTQPVLVVYGTGDVSMPIEQGALQVLHDTAQAGNDDVTVRYYDGANHGIRVGGDVVPAFLRDLSGWVRGLPGTAGATPQVAGEQPTQVYLAGPVPQPRWLVDGSVMLATVVAAAGMLALAGAAVALDRGVHEVRTRRRQDLTADERAGHRLAPGVVGPLVALGAGAAVTVVALVWYLLSVARLAMDYQRDPWVVQGGWLTVRVLGIMTVVAAVLLGRRVQAVRRAGRRVAPGLVRTAAVWVVVAGAGVLLVVLAYWGVYQLGI